MTGLDNETKLDHRTPIAYRGLIVGTMISLAMWAVIFRIVGWFI